ncbi:TPA: hypothetical protein DEA21_05800 [Candidatus Uhrbacteria bacterium]|nr:hypothetical protein [Candidatus Uhrbacteria bacterium]HCU31122.1 hypothetical protein [Candidatus Uhrbacteria bacterium]
MNKILVGSFLIAVTGLLLAARFGFEFAGGEGYVEALPAQVEIISGSVTVERSGVSRTAVNGESLKRGEIIRTSDTTRAIIKIGERISIVLDERTDVSIEQILPSQVEIKIIRGRLLAKTSNETEELLISTPVSFGSINSGILSVVRYDWLDKTDYLPFGTTVFVNQKDDYKNVSQGGVEALEKEPFGLTKIDFDWQGSSAVEFYEWVSEMGFLGF